MTSPSLLTEAQIAARLAGSTWKRDHAMITRALSFDDFAAAIAYVNLVAEVSESYNHHPDILVHGWNKVTLSLTNHAAGGLTEIDFDMAARFDALRGRPAA